VLSIEMFEHMSNYRALLQRVASWLLPEGLLFVHHFAHRDLAYPFNSEASNEWMAKHFFSGGIMPSANLLARFPEHLGVVEAWEVNGRHYQRTCEAWLRRMSSNRQAIHQIFADAYGPGEARKHYHYWRIFFMACAELFGFRDGNEWFVVHSLLAPRTHPEAPSAEATRRSSCES
jgi:cyclopropane-fatty-acyl-phospholipid synthase